jgi:hypothetical protein
MRTLDPLLQSLGRQLLRWGAVLAQAGRRDEAADLAPPPIDPAAEARAIWRARVAGVPAGAWQGPQGPQDAAGDADTDAIADADVAPSPLQGLQAVVQGAVAPSAPARAVWPAHEPPLPPYDIRLERPQRAAFAEPSRGAWPRDNGGISQPSPPIDSRRPSVAPIDVQPDHDGPATEAPPPLAQAGAPAARARSWRYWLPALFASLWPLREPAPQRACRIVRVTPASTMAAPRADGHAPHMTAHYAVRTPLPHPEACATSSSQPSVPPSRWRRMGSRWPLRFARPDATGATAAAAEAPHRAGPTSASVVRPVKDLAAAPIKLPPQVLTPPVTQAAPRAATPPRAAPPVLPACRPAPPRDATFDSLLQAPTPAYHWPELPAWPASEPALETLDRGAVARLQRLEVEQRG